MKFLSVHLRMSEQAKMSAKDLSDTMGTAHDDVLAERDFMQCWAEEYSCNTRQMSDCSARQMSVCLNLLKPPTNIACQMF